MYRMTEYLIWMIGSALAVSAWYGWAVSREHGGRRGTEAALVTLALGVLCGAAGAKAGYMILRADLISSAWIQAMLRTWEPDTLSFVGGGAGVCAGVALGAKMLGMPVREALNTFAPMGAALAGLARFGEGFLGMLGVGEYLEESFFPLAVRFTWDGEWFEYYVAVFIFEGLAALAACLLSLKHGKEPDRFRRTVFYLCLPQILLESLRMQSISWLFVRCEQLVCFLICEGILIFYGIRSTGKDWTRWRPAIVGLLLCVVVIIGEFALDGKISMPDGDIPAWLIYSVVGLFLAWTAEEEHRGHRLLPNPLTE